MTALFWITLVGVALLYVAMILFVMRRQRQVWDEEQQRWKNP